MTIHPDNFTVDPGQFEGVPMVTLRGVFRGKDAYQWAREEFAKILKGGATTIIIHMGGVSKIDSGALGVLSEAAVLARKAGGKVKLVAVPDNVQHLLDVTNLYTLFEIFPDTKSAVDTG